MIGGGGGERGWGIICASEALASLLSKRKNYGTVTFEIFTHTQHFPGMLQLLYAYDPQLSQGLTVDEESAHLRGTVILYSKPSSENTDFTTEYFFL
jgi:hypothetical protein